MRQPPDNTETILLRVIARLEAALSREEAHSLELEAANGRQALVLGQLREIFGLKTDVPVNTIVSTAAALVATLREQVMVKPPVVDKAIVEEVLEFVQKLENGEPAVSRIGPTSATVAIRTLCASVSKAC